MKERSRWVWVVSAVVALGTLSLLATACSDSNSLVSGGGGSNQSVVTIMGADQ